MPPLRRHFAATGLGLSLLLLSGCYSWMHAAAAQEPPSPSPSPTPSPTARPSARSLAVPHRFYPLPGALDLTDVFNSNSPEIVQDTGILLSTLPQREPGDASVFLDHAFSGRFALFSHHLTRESKPGDRILYTGLVATNLGGKPVDLAIERGVTFLTQPDAPFIPLPAVTADPEGRIFAGPGDRTTTELLHDRSHVPDIKAAIAPRQSRLVYSLPIPANTAGETPANGRGTMLAMSASGPVYLSEIALFVMRSRDGTFHPPTFEDYRKVLDQRVLAGRREAPSYFYEPHWPVAEGFRYGRVCGVSRGDTWTGELFGSDITLPGPGERVGFPIASLYKKRLGTGQVQSAPMIKRYHDTAVQGQGNYGVTYDLTLNLANPDGAARDYTLALSSPEDVVTDAGVKQATYLDPPSAQVTFRGSVRLDWLSPQKQTRYVHLVMHQGELMPPFQVVTVPPRTTTRLRLRLKYPADATPPQLLTIGRPS